MGLKNCKQFVCLLMVVFLFGGCSDQHHQHREKYREWMQPNGKVKVLSTTGIIDDIVKNIAGEYADTIPLIKGDLDPHSYQLVKGDDEKLSQADIIFYNGLGLEHGPSLYHYLTKNPQAIALGDHIDRQDDSLIIYVNGVHDPHIWMDISLWAKTVPIIVEKLSEKDPNHASYYAQNGQQVIESMMQVHNKVLGIMHEVPEEKRYLVTSHDAFNYFTRAYLSEKKEVPSGDWEKRFAAPEGLAPESQLSVLDIRAIIEHLRRYQIHLLFPESNVSRDSIKKIVQAGKEQGLDIQIACCALYGDAMGEPGSEGDTYLKMILYNAKTLSEELNRSNRHGS